MTAAQRLGLAKPLAALTRTQAQNSIANRFAPVADRLRQRIVRAGLRPYRVFLLWTEFSGDERGEGVEKVARITEILPSPKVVSLDALSLAAVSAGVIPIGSVRIERISECYTFDQLMGHWVPTEHEKQIPENITFSWEIVEDGRGDADPIRQRFRILTPPVRRAGKFDWTVTLERSMEDRDRKGRTRFGPEQIGSGS